MNAENKKISGPPFVSADQEHTEIGFAEVAGAPELRRGFYLRNGVAFSNGVILGLN